MAKNVQTAVLVSGGGTTLQNLMDRIEQGTLDARIDLVISSDPEAYALRRASRAGIEAVTVDRSRFDSREAFSQQITRVLDRMEPDLICMAGFIHFYVIPDHYLWHVMNIHPALLPDYGGKGYYKDRVHREVLESGDDVTGCTVHFADNRGYDRGPIILQKEVAVKPDDTVESLSERVFEAECEAYPEAIQLYAENRIQVKNGEEVVLLSPEEARE